MQLRILEFVEAFDSFLGERIRGRTNRQRHQDLSEFQIRFTEIGGLVFDFENWLEHSRSN
jgi:hypothetical protein